MDIRNHAQQEPNIDEKVLDEYMRLSALYQDKYGPKTIVLYQIGKFYEVYGYKHPDHDIIQGSIVEEFADVCDLKFVHVLRNKGRMDRRELFEKSFFTFKNLLDYPSF